MRQWNLKVEQQLTTLLNRIQSIWITKRQNNVLAWVWEGRRAACTQCESQYLPGTEWQANWGATFHNSSLLSQPVAGRLGRVVGEGTAGSQRFVSICLLAGGSYCLRLSSSLASAESHTKPSLYAVSDTQKVDIGHPQPLFTCRLALMALLLSISKLLLIFNRVTEGQAGVGAERGTDVHSVHWFGVD